MAKFFVLLLLVFIASSCGGKEDSGSASATLANQCNGPIVSAIIIDDLEWTGYEELTNPDEISNSSPVGQLVLPKKYTACTAFLINEDTIMTNNHCVGNAEEAQNASFKIRTKNEGRKTYSCENLLVTDFRLDFTLIKCQGEPGKKHGFIGFGNSELKRDDQIYVVQENCNYLDDPKCSVNKYISYGNMMSARSWSVIHDADTLPGSSGSPIFNQENHSFIALHHAGQADSANSPGKNFGIPSAKIKSFIKNQAPNIILYEKSRAVKKVANGKTCY